MHGYIIKPPRKRSEEEFTIHFKVQGEFRKAGCSCYEVGIDIHESLKNVMMYFIFPSG